jgi:hypothetical protein
MSVKTYSYLKDGSTYLSTHFQVKEFASTNGSTLYSDTVLIDSDLVTMLEKLFSTLNLSKMVIVSGYRTSSHDKAVGGNGSGQHTLGKAADICCYDKSGSVISAKIICCVATDIIGFKGCANISANYRNVHVDTRTTKYYGDECKGNNSIWYYNSKYTDFYTYFGLTKSEVNKYISSSTSTTSSSTTTTKTTSSSTSSSGKLNPDSVSVLNGVTVKEYLLTKHNTNKIDMPTGNINNLLGITIHNTDDLSGVDEDAEQYTRATVNGNMKTVRVHYYVDDVNAWQNLPLTLQGWHAADGNGNGNTRTIAIECIMSSSNTSDSESAKAEDNAARLAAYLLNKYNMTVEDNLFTHLHWLNVKNGRTGTNDYLNTTKLSGAKYCPIYILPHWSTFCNKVNTYLKALKSGSTTSTTSATSGSTQIYRIRKSWSSVSSQIGAFNSLESAIAGYKTGYYIYDSNGNVVYPTTSSTSSISVGDTVKVNSNATAYNGAKLSSIVYKNEYTVISVNNDRVVIGLNGVVTAAVKSSDLTKL